MYPRTLHTTNSLPEGCRLDLPCECCQVPVPTLPRSAVAQAYYETRVSQTFLYMALTRVVTGCDGAVSNHRAEVPTHTLTHLAGFGRFEPQKYLLATTSARRRPSFVHIATTRPTIYHFAHCRYHRSFDPILLLMTETYPQCKQLNPISRSKTKSSSITKAH